MLSHAELLAALQRLKDDGHTTNADIGRLLKLPSSRIAEMFDGTRKINVDEMKALVEHFELETPLPAPSADALAPLLDALLPLQPPGRQTDQSLRVLGAALSHGLELLGDRLASSPSGDAIEVAARGAVVRFRELTDQ